jgi:peptide-methionine (R)-S-oxide reductase
LALGAAAVLPLDCQRSAPVARETGSVNDQRVAKSDDEWRETLTPEQYRVLREKGTERPFTGNYWDMKDDGTYVCAGCGQELFTSDTKFDSGCGWPSFYDAIDKGRIELREDTSHGMHRTEVVCSKCGGHLGHVFDDGPDPTGKRYCINSASLDFEPKSDRPDTPDKSEGE